MSVKYPRVFVRLTGADGNAHAVVGQVRHALRMARIPQSEINVFSAEALSGDYDKLLRTCMAWVNVT